MMENFKKNFKEVIKYLDLTEFDFEEIVNT